MDLHVEHFRPPGLKSRSSCPGPREGVVDEGLDAFELVAEGKDLVGEVGLVGLEEVFEVGCLQACGPGELAAHGVPEDGDAAVGGVGVDGGDGGDVLAELLDGPSRASSRLRDAPQRK